MEGTPSCIILSLLVKFDPPPLWLAQCMQLAGVKAFLLETALACDVTPLLSYYSAVKHDRQTETSYKPISVHDIRSRTY